VWIQHSFRALVSTPPQDSRRRKVTKAVVFIRSSVLHDSSFGHGPVVTDNAADQDGGFYPLFGSDSSFGNGGPTVTGQATLQSSAPAAPSSLTTPPIIVLCTPGSGAVPSLIEDTHEMMKNSFSAALHAAPREASRGRRSARQDTG
jgi:hypothetical protein